MRPYRVIRQRGDPTEVLTGMTSHKYRAIKQCMHSDYAALLEPGDKVVWPTHPDKGFEVGL